MINPALKLTVVGGVRPLVADSDYLGLIAWL